MLKIREIPFLSANYEVSVSFSSNPDMADSAIIAEVSELYVSGVMIHLLYTELGSTRKWDSLILKRLPIKID